MMSEIVGEIATSTKVVFKWEIPDLITKNFENLDSPAFSFSNAEWCLRISEEKSCALRRKNLYLVVQNPSSEILVTFTLSIGYPTVLWQFGPETCLFDQSSTFHGTKNPLINFDLEEKCNKDGSLVIYCHADENQNTACQRTLLNKSSTIILNKLEDMLLSGRRSDVEIVVRDQRLKAHKIILEARSPVFAAMFEHDITEKRENIIKVEDSDPDDFQLFLRCVYTGKFDNLSVDKAISLYIISHKYSIPDIMEKCVQHMEENLSDETACDILVLAHRYNETGLRSSVKNYMSQNLDTIRYTKAWISLIKEQPVLQKFYGITLRK